jgi:hypothetical protein
MPQQLIYTSAPRGIVAGRSGHCTVARSASMREALMLQLEKFCYYQHLSLSGGQERPIFSCRIVDIRGTRFHVLSRIQDAGLDFTGRTNFIAHHLVFTPEEIRQFPTPPVILRDWPGWVKLWTKEPQLLENEDWVELTALANKTNVPAQTWQRVTGDAVNGYGLLEARAGASFRVDDLADETVLELIAESLELLEVRDTRRDFRTAAWNYTFTTSMQEQDNPADFRWRCIHSDNPAANRFATPDCRALSAVRATKLTGEETAFAKTGRQAPQFVAEPQDARITEGEPARFTAKAEGVPSPIYQWFSVDRANNGQVLPGETNPELMVSNPALGISRYVVSVTNNAGNVQSRVATLSVEQKLKLAQVRVDTGSRATAKPALYNVKSEEDIERQRRRLEAEKAQEIFQKRLRRNKILVTVFTILLIAGAGVFIWIRHAGNKPSERPSEKPPHNSGDAALANPAINQLASTKAALPTNASSASPSIPEPARAGQTIFAQDEFKPLLPPWTNATVGKVKIESSATMVGDTFVLKGAGKNIYDTADSFFFVFQSISNSADFSSQILKITSGLLTTRCGIMMRESEKADAPFVFIGVSSTNVFFVYRASAGETCKQTRQTASTPSLFLKLTRRDNSFVGSYSIDNQQWTSVATNSIAMSSQNGYLIGFALCSGNSNKTVGVEFGKISLSEVKAKN